MKYLLDTNIIILLIKNKQFGKYFETEFQLKYPDDLYYTHISLGEVDSIVKQNKWGQQKLTHLSNILQGFGLLEATDVQTIQNYGTIDAFSQGKLQNQALPQGMSARNMGKNDLWIAAMAMTLQATLITTDKDFHHLDTNFFKVHWIDIELFK